MARSIQEARRVLREADLSTPEGREAAQAALDFLEAQDSVPRDLQQQAEQVREEMIAEVTSSSPWFFDWPDIYRKVRRTNRAAGERIWEAIKWAGRTVDEGFAPELTDQAGILDRTREARAVEAAWPHLTDAQRDQARERGVAPAEAGTRAPSRASQDAASARLEGQARQFGVEPGADAASDRLTRSGASQRGVDTQARREWIEQRVAEGMSPEDAEAAAEMFFGQGDGPDLRPPLIGVPEDHFIREQTFDGDRMQFDPDMQAAMGPIRREPRYREGDQERPFGWSSERLADLQKRLVAAGLLQGDFRWGWYDAPTGQAYAQALGSANLRAVDVWDALDQLAVEHEQRREESISEAIGAFTPEPFQPRDRDEWRSRARQALIGIGRPASQIGEDEIEAMADVMSGEFRRAHEIQVEADRRMHEAQVRNEFADEGAQPVTADLSDLEQVDPVWSFNEWFQSEYAGEIETRETSERVGRAGQTFDQGLRSMVSQVRGGGA